jgi:peptide/nickel transport system permease protein
MAPYLIMLTAFSAGHPPRSLAVIPGLGVSEPRPLGPHAARGRRAVREAAPGWRSSGARHHLAVFAFNLFGDSLRDALDPRLRTQ